MTETPTPTPIKRSIKSSVNVHDRTQIETVFDYFLHRGPPRGVGKDEIEYRVECFLFYPRQFGLDATTYPKERFYNDIRPMLRFREPRLGTKQMLGMKTAVESPLLYLGSYIAELAVGKMNDPLPRAIDEVRVFACSFVSNYLKNIDRKRKRFMELRSFNGPERDAAMSDALRKAARVVEKAHTTVLEYRKLIDAAMRLPEGFAEDLKHELKLVDEYCYYRMRDGIAYLLLMTEDCRFSAATSDAQAFMEQITGLIKLHDDHARVAGFIVIETSSSASVKERFIRRRGELKRRIWSVLFLDIRTQPLFSVQRQMGAMIAAGFAAIWAVLAQVILIRRIMFSDAQNDLIGLSGLTFLSAGVFAYVIKDRIKEIGRSYFRSGLFREVPDQSERLNYRSKTGETIPIGAIKEVAVFKALDKLPSYISTLRAQLGAKTISDAESVDAVLCYTKTITLHRRIKILGRYPLRAVHDILRLNIDACLPRLGEPTRRLHIVDAQGDVSAVEFPKVYYLDMALSYSQIEPSEDAAGRTVEYFRLVIDKNGLQRIERLS